MMTLDAWDLAKLDAFARSVAHLHRRHASPAFSRYAMDQGWFGSPVWIPARNRFMATWRATRTANGQREADRAARNEWRAYADEWQQSEWAA
jgi:hypothetical protein